MYNRAYNWLMQRHHAFEWDSRKAVANLRKHGVTFEDAADVLADEFADEFQSEFWDADSEEERIVTLGSAPYDRSRIYFIVWTPREEITRIISARTATREERGIYDEEIYGK